MRLHSILVRVPPTVGIWPISTCGTGETYSYCGLGMAYTTHLWWFSGWFIGLLLDIRFTTLSNWWLTYPPEKYEFVRLGSLFPTEWKVIKFTFQTTNQLCILDIWYIHDSCPPCPRAFVRYSVFYMVHIHCSYPNACCL